MYTVFNSRLRHTFRALRHEGFRVFWLGQWVSVTGTWMQSMALAWLVYRLTGSPMALGVLSVARFGPSLLGSPLAGVITDRFPRRHLVLCTQATSMLIASALTALTMSGKIQIWQILVMALLQGVVDTLDMPARQTMQMELVGPEDLQSAISLNSAAFNAGRLVGPAVAGIVVARMGEGFCFLANSVSYLAVLVAVYGMSPEHPDHHRSRRSVSSEFLEGARFAWGHAEVRHLLASIAVTSLVGLSTYTLLPVFSRDILRSGPQGYGVLLGAGGVGAVAGALVAAGRKGVGRPLDTAATGLLVLGVGLVALGATRELWLTAVWMVMVGVSAAIQMAVTNSFLQTCSPPALRGRVLSLYIWLFAGLSPLGGFAAGVAASQAGAPWTAAGAGAICFAYGAALLLNSRRSRRPPPGPRRPGSKFFTAWPPSCGRSAPEE